MNPPNPDLPAGAYQDRSTGLVVFGVFTVLLGCLCGLFVPLMFVGQAMGARAGAPPADYRTMAPAGFMYGGMAIVLVTLGVGSIRARRWARALLLMFSWSWLVVGVMAVGFWAAMAPQFLKAMSAAAPPGQPEMPAAGKLVVAAITFGMLAVIFIVLPAVWVLFYKSRHVKATCEARDPVVRWTDRCPLPVLAVSVWLALGAPMMLAMPLLYHGVFPFFGGFLTGLPGTATQVALAGVWGYCARAFYRLDARGWWVLVASLCVFTVSHLLTFSRHDLPELYQLMGYPESQIEQLRQFDFLSGGAMAWGGLLTMMPFLGYLVYVKRYFRHATVGPVPPAGR